MRHLFIILSLMLAATPGHAQDEQGAFVVNYVAGGQVRSTTADGLSFGQTAGNSHYQLSGTGGDSLLALGINLRDVQYIARNASTKPTATVVGDVNGNTRVTGYQADGTITMTTDGDIPQVGQVLVSAPTEAAPRGFLRKVTDVRQEGGNIILQTTECNISEALPNCKAQVALPWGDMQFEAVDSRGNRVPLKQTTATDDIDKARLQRSFDVPVFSSKKIVKGVNDFIGFFQPGEAEVDEDMDLVYQGWMQDAEGEFDTEEAQNDEPRCELNGNIHFTVDCAADFIYDSSLGIIQELGVKFEGSVTATPSLTFEIGGKFEILDTIKIYSITPICFTIFGVPVEITPCFAVISHIKWVGKKSTITTTFSPIVGSIEAQNIIKPEPASKRKIQDYITLNPLEWTMHGPPFFNMRKLYLDNLGLNYKNYPEIISYKNPFKDWTLGNLFKEAFRNSTITASVSGKLTGGIRPTLIGKVYDSDDCQVGLGLEPYVGLRGELSFKYDGMNNGSDLSWNDTEVKDELSAIYGLNLHPSARLALDIPVIGKKTLLDKTGTINIIKERPLGATLSLFAKIKDMKISPNHDVLTDSKGKVHVTVSRDTKAQIFDEEDFGICYRPKGEGAPWQYISLKDKMKPVSIREGNFVQELETDIPIGGLLPLKTYEVKGWSTYAPFGNNPFYIYRNGSTFTTGSVNSNDGGDSLEDIPGEEL